jgi:RNA polymerase sigma-70 factor, ECF subfamily
MSDHYDYLRRATILQKAIKDAVLIEIMDRLRQEIFQKPEIQEMLIKIRIEGRESDSILNEPIMKEAMKELVEALTPVIHFEEFTDFYRPLLYTLAMQILSNHHSAEDVVQESLMKAYIALKSFSIQQLRTLHLRPWLCAIARNTANNYRRDERKFEFLDLSESSEFLEIEASQFEQPEVALMIHIAEQEVEKLLCSLPKKYRTLLLLRFQEEYSYKELAETLKYKKLGTLKCYLHRSLRRLRKIAEEEGINENDLEIWAQAQVVHHDSA